MFVKQTICIEASHILFSLAIVKRIHFCSFVSKLVKMAQRGRGAAGVRIGRIGKIGRRNNVEVTEQMIQHCLSVMRPSFRIKDGFGGHALGAIRNYIQDVYNLDMNKVRQALLKHHMTAMFRKGQITMSNSTGRLNFNKRFMVHPESETNAIRNYIRDYYNLDMNKVRQELIKHHMRVMFRNGKIWMSNSTGQPDLLQLRVRCHP